MRKSIAIIDNIYTDATFHSRYGLDIFLTILIFITMLGFIGYWTILNNLQSIKNHWDTEKCNPMYMPFVHLINPDPSLTADEQIQQNADRCLRESGKSLAAGSLKDIYDKIGGINGIISDFQKFTNFMQMLFLWLFNVIAYGINFLLSALQKTFLGVTHIFLKVESMFNKFIGVLLTNFFVFIQLFNMAIAFILNFASIATVMIIVPLSMTLSILSAIALALVVLIAIFTALGIFGFFMLPILYAILTPVLITLVAVAVILIIMGLVASGLIQIQNTAKKFIAPSLARDPTVKVSPQFAGGNSNMGKPANIDKQIQQFKSSRVHTIIK